MALPGFDDSGDATDGQGSGSAIPYEAPAAAAAAPATSTDQSPSDSTGPQLTPNARTIVDTMDAAGYSPVAIASKLAVSNYEGRGLDPTAVNPTSGAVGIDQDLGPRKEGLRAFAERTGGDPTDIHTQIGHTMDELSGTDPYDNENAVDKRIRAAQTLEDGVSAWRAGFERPGVDYDGVVLPLAKQTLPIVTSYLDSKKAQLGQNAGGPNLEAPLTEAPLTDAGPDAAAQDKAAWDQVLQTRARALGQPDPTLPGPPSVEKVQLPPTETSPSADPWGEALQLRTQARAKAAMATAASAPATGPQGGSYTPPAPNPGFLGEMGKAGANIGSGIVRGVATLLGIPADALSATSTYYAQHPWLAQSTGFGGMVIPTVSPRLPDQPGATSAISTAVAPATSKSITSDANVAGGAIGLGPHAFSSPAELGDYDVGHNAEFGLGAFIGSGIDPFNPLGAIGAGRALLSGSAKTALAGVGKEFATHWMAPAAMAGGADAGDYLGDKLGGQRGAQIGANLAAVPLGILGRAALEGGLVKATEGGKSLLGGIGGEKPQIFDNPTSAHAALKDGTFESGLPVPGAGLPEGYLVPAATKTMDQGGQAFFQQTVHQDRLANGNYRDLLERNTAALHGALPGGDPSDAVNYVRNVQDARQQTVDMRIAAARSDADLAQMAASRSSAGQGLMVGAPGKAQLFDYGNEVVNQLAAARDDAKAMADDAWDVARQGGFTSATTDPRPLYNAIEGLAQKQIQNLQAPGTFPYKELAPLYQDGDLRGMFTPAGVRKPGTIGAGSATGPNAVLQGPVSLDTLHNLESSLGAAARQEQDAIRSGSGTGSALRLSNINAVRNVISQTIERGAMEGGNYASMRNAMNATATYYNTFGQGIIGDLISSADSSLAPQKVAAYLGNSTKAQASAVEFARAAEMRTGAADARSAAPSTFDPAAQGMGTGLPGIGGNPGTTPAQALNNSIADYLRQDYLLVRSEGGPLAGEKWAQKHGAFLNSTSGSDPTDPFTRLRDDVARLNQSDAVLPQLQDQTARDQDSVDVKMAQNFLGANEGKEIEAALRGQNPADGMQRLVNLTRQDATGQAFRGLQRMMFDRVMAAAQKYDPAGNVYYSGKAAQAFMQANRGAFSVLRNADPVVGGNLDKLINGLAAEDAIRAKPEVAGLPRSLAEAAPMPGQSVVSRAVGTLGPLAGKIFGAEFGRRLETGTIQIPGLFSELGGNAFNYAYKTVTGKEAPHIVAMDNLRNAMFDPAKTEEYLAAQAQTNGQLTSAPTLAESAARGASAGHRAATGATSLNLPGAGAATQTDNQPQATFSLAKPWVRSGAFQAANSMLNSGDTTPPIQHRYPVTPPLHPGARTPWDR